MTIQERHLIKCKHGSTRVKNGWIVKDETTSLRNSIGDHGSNYFRIMLQKLLSSTRHQFFRRQYFYFSIEFLCVCMYEKELLV